jgi:hypothetical protein
MLDSRVLGIQNAQKKSLQVYGTHESTKTLKTFLNDVRLCRNNERRKAASERKILKRWPHNFMCD